MAQRGFLNSLALVYVYHAHFESAYRKEVGYDFTQ